jgi:hypothetical protein
MTSSAIWRRVAVVRAEVSEERVTLKMGAVRSLETSAPTRATRRHIPEDDILHSHRRENLKFYLQDICKCKLSCSMQYCSHVNMAGYSAIRTLVSLVTIAVVAWIWAAFLLYTSKLRCSRAWCSTRLSLQNWSGHNPDHAQIWTKFSHEFNTKYPYERRLEPFHCVIHAWVVRCISCNNMKI